jgi:hypothetical protein
MAARTAHDLNDPPLLDEQQLVAQLSRNRAALRDGTACFNGVPIHHQSVLTRYVCVTAYLFHHRWEYSRYFVYEREPAGSLPGEYNLHSLLCGWWEIPMGPVRTLVAVVTNLPGGALRRVIDLIGDDALHRDDVIKLTERAASAARLQMAERGFPEGSPAASERQGG